MTAEGRSVPNPYMRIDNDDFQTRADVYREVWEIIVAGAENLQFSSNPLIRLAQAAATYSFNMHAVQFGARPDTEARRGLAAETGAAMRQFVQT